MKKKVLSALICSAMAVSQAAMIPVLADSENNNTATGLDEIAVGNESQNSNKEVLNSKSKVTTGSSVTVGNDKNNKDDEINSFDVNDIIGGGSESQDDLVKDDNNIAEKVEWKSTLFGVKTCDEDNQIEPGKDENGNTTVKLTSGTADATHTGGKVTGSNDGISYYYTEIDPSKNFELSATVKVNFFEKITKPDNQCAFGIMARDTIGPDRDDSTAPSNMVLVGGYRNYIQSVYRSGVTTDLDDTITMNGVHKFKDTPKKDGTSVYKLKLRKTNTGYICSVGDGEEVTYYEPKLLEVANSNKIYLGFFTARVASIDVSNISLIESDVASDPAGEPAPVEKITPKLDINSPTATGDSSYTLNLATNAQGKVDVKLNGQDLASKEITTEDDLKINAELIKGNNQFKIIYTPNESENNTSNEIIEKTYNVTLNSYGAENGVIYVSPEGTKDGSGTVDSPLDINTAVSYIGQGQTIKVKGGNYNISDSVYIDINNSGNEKNIKTLESYDGRAVFDFGAVGEGFRLDGSYWNITGIDVTNTKDASAGLRVAGSHNVLENIKTYKNGDTGLQVSSPSQTTPKKLWPSYNLIINCDSYDNMDAAQNNADGFAAKITTGEGNVFRGCIARNNCDDGWDLFSKLENGKIGAVTIENCIAYGNGTLSDGTKTNGDGNGFKLGGEGLPVKHTLVNSLSFNNDAVGITSNSNPAMIVKNSISADNKKANYILDYYTSAKLDFELKNVKSFINTEADMPEQADSIPDCVKGKDNYYFNGINAENIDGEKLTADMFKSTAMPKTVERDENNNIIWPDFMSLKETSLDNNTGDSDNSIGKPGDNAGDSNNDTVKPEDNTGDSDNSTDKTEDNTNNSGDNTNNSVSTSSSSSKHHHSSSSSDSKSSDTESENKAEITAGTSDTNSKTDDKQTEVTKDNWNKNSDGSWSLISNDGKKATGWAKVENTWYYLNNEGIMQTGWIKDSSNNWYHLNENGSMSIGWVKDNTNNWYYLNENGTMHTGWLKDNNGLWYFLKEDGSMHTGWVKDTDGNWYYLNESGAMCTDTIIDGYKIGSNGAWIQ
ncbi:MAG: N-acetylmuramoyl-L-alanine amidase family protein [Romboutsia sp.]|nr:N-acetylmuramoyl-L-alanine amidase family protein [Romboutsia sp.]